MVRGQFLIWIWPFKRTHLPRRKAFVYLLISRSRNCWRLDEILLIGKDKRFELVLRNYYYDTNSVASFLKSSGSLRKFLKEFFMKEQLDTKKKVLFLQRIQLPWPHCPNPNSTIKNEKHEHDLKFWVGQVLKLLRPEISRSCKTFIQSSSEIGSMTPHSSLSLL